MSEVDGTSSPEEIGCLEAIESLYAYLDGQITDPAAQERIAQHLGHCRSCYSRSELERALTQRLRERAAQPAPEAMRARLRALMESF